MASAILPPSDSTQGEDLATIRDMVMRLLDENVQLRSRLCRLRETNSALAANLERARAAARHGRPRAAN